MYNWGLRVSEATKTISDKVVIAGGEGWEACLDNHTMTTSDVYIGFYANEDDEEEEDEVGLVWVSAFLWGTQSYLKDKKAVGLGCCPIGRGR